MSNAALKPIAVEGIENGRRVGVGRKTGEDTARARRYVINYINRNPGRFNTAEVVRNTKLNRYRVTRVLMWLEDRGIIERVDTVKIKKGPGAPVIIWNRTDTE